MPKIGAIKVKQRDGKYYAHFDVTFIKALTEKVPGATEKGIVVLAVHGSREKNGKLGETVQETRLEKVIGSTRRRTYDIALSDEAVMALKLDSGSLDQHLLRVRVAHVISGAPHDLSPNYVADHTKLASKSWAGNPKLAPPKAGGVNITFSSGDQPTVTLVNNTGVPINLVEYDIMCMYDNLQNDSDPSGFNSQQGATLAPGGTIEQTPAGNGSITTEASYQGPAPQTLAQTLTQFGVLVTSKAASLLDIPALSSIINAWDSCGTNASSFGIAAIDPVSKQASNEAWVITSEYGDINSGLYQDAWFTGPGCSECSVNFSNLGAADYAEVQIGNNWLDPYFWETATHQMFSAMYGDVNDIYGVQGSVLGSYWDGSGPSWIADYGLSWQTAATSNNSFTITVNMGGTTNEFPASYLQGY
ncbi:MAG: hypothetical protein PHT19_13705 [Methylococcus sp.]|nr:hypothetical protein [Methylococcus sp.]